MNTNINNKLKKVSIIIPTYNTEDYISDCLKSVLNQTYSNIEIVIVDDGSSDNTSSVISTICEKEKNIRFYENKNFGVSYSRNYAMNQCTGEYIAFVDSDDIIASDYIETLVTTIEMEKADMSAVTMVKKSIFNENDFSDGNSVIYYGENIITQLFGVYEGFLVNKLYKKCILEKYSIRFHEDILVCEDLLFNMEYLDHCNRVVLNSGRKYFYRQRRSSASCQLDNIKWFDIFQAYSIILKLLKKYPSAEKRAIERYAISLCEAQYRLRFFSRSKRKEIKKRIRNQWKKICPRLKNISYKYKLKILIFLMLPECVMKYRRRKVDKFNK